MSEELLNLQFEILSRKVGDAVSCKVWEAGKETIYVGQLIGVAPFDTINLDNQLIPFVGTTQAIEEITLDGTDRTLYTNPKVKGYQGFTAKDIMGLVNAQREFLGRSIIMDGMEKRDEERRHR
ncbi:MAG: hypothetical protein HFH08_05945 [Bacilli bacterium]|jgi:hypothetical protein|nr:hypothetical protein [Bacilli bacterium]